MMKDYEELFKEYNNNFQLFSCESNGSDVLITFRDNDKKFHRETIKDFKPYFFVPRIDLKDFIPFIPLNKVQKVEVDHPGFIKKQREKYKYTYEGDVFYDIRFQLDTYCNYTSSLFVEPRVWFFDIEVYREYGFGMPNYNNKNHFINAITFHDNYTEKLVTIVVDKNNKSSMKNDKKETTIRVKTERKLLELFFEMFQKSQVDITIGWNTIYFDNYYIIKRLESFYPDLLDKFSHFGIRPEIRELEKTTGIEYQYQTYGFSMMDYLMLYRKYTPTPREKYSLDYIGQVEVDEGKEEYEGSLDKLYEENIEKFIDYSKQDVALMVKLDEKLQYISLVNEFKELTSCPMKYFNYKNTLKYVDSILIRYLRNYGLCVRTRPKDVENYGKFKGAYVRPPSPGRWSWTTDMDASSLYPSTILTLNSSPETYIGRIMEDEDIITDYIRPYLSGLTNECDIDKVSVKNQKNQIVSMDIKELKERISKKTDNAFTISISGAIFDRNKKGIITEIQTDLINKRKEYKDLKKVWENVEGIIENYNESASSDE